MPPCRGKRATSRLTPTSTSWRRRRSSASEYLTYVLWAITPEGRATNLGEVQRDDADARVQVTTELQAFGLVLTAEPYFAVTQPSDVVVMENMSATTPRAASRPFRPSTSC